MKVHKTKRSHKITVPLFFRYLIYNLQILLLEICWFYYLYMYIKQGTEKNICTFIKVRLFSYIGCFFNYDITDLALIQ